MLNRNEKDQIQLLILLVIFSFIIAYLIGDEIQQIANDYISTFGVSTLTFLLISFSISLLYLFGQFRKYGLKKAFGSRIGEIYQEGLIFVWPRTIKEYTRSWFKSLAISVVLVPITIFVFHRYLSLSPLRLDMSVALGLIVVSCLHFLFATKAKKDLKNMSKKSKTWKKKLPRRPIANKYLTICSVGERPNSWDQVKTTSPKWFSMTKKSLLGNIVIFGTIGSGKTASVAINIFNQMMSIYENSTIFIADKKGTFLENVKGYIKSNQRTLYRIDESTDFRFNLVYRKNLLKDGQFEEVASLIRNSSLAIIGDDPKNRFWSSTAYHLTKACLVLCYVKYGYFTAIDLRREMNQFDDETIKNLEESLLDDPDKFDEEEKFNIMTCLEELKSSLKQGKDLRSSIITSARVFLDSLSDYRLAKIFCPKEEEINLFSMDELLKEKAIILVSFRSDEVYQGLGAYFKKSFYDTIRKNHEKNLEKSKNTYLFFGDEYQEIATIHDVNNVATGREFQIISVVATQSYSSLLNKLGTDSVTKEFLNNMRTKICLNVTDENTINYFNTIAGERDVQRTSQAINESSINGDRDNLDSAYTADKLNIGLSLNKSENREKVLRSNDVTNLSDYEGIVFGYDGLNSALFKGYFKPHFKDERISHFQLTKELNEKGNSELLSMAKEAV